MQPIFENAFKKNGIDSNLAKFVRYYYTNPDKWNLIDFAEEVLESFSARNFYQVVLSNHVPELEELITNLGIRKYFKEVYNSALTGYEKPHQMAFQLVKDSFPEVEEFWMVGDSLNIDIKGGKNAEFKTIWFNPNGKKCNEKGIVEKEIACLKEIEEL